MKPHGISASIASKYAYADLYGNRTGKRANCASPASQDTPGTCILARPSSSINGPVVACLMGQIAPGKPGNWSKQYNVQPDIDNASCRCEYFKSALNELATACQNEGWKLIAFPYNIGCGLAGGSWTDYCTLLEEFAHNVSVFGVSVIVCKR